MHRMSSTHQPASDCVRILATPRETRTDEIAHTHSQKALRFLLFDCLHEFCRWSKWSDLLTYLFRFSLAWFVVHFFFRLSLSLLHSASTNAESNRKSWAQCGGNFIKSFARFHNVNVVHRSQPQLLIFALLLVANVLALSLDALN